MPSPDRMNAGSHVSICSIFYIKKVLISNEVQMYVIFFNLMAISKKNESPLFQTCWKPIEKMVQTIEAKRLTDKHIASVQEKVLSCGASRRYLHVKQALVGMQASTIWKGFSR